VHVTTTRRALLAGLLVLTACAGGSSTAPTAEPSTITLSAANASFSSLLATQDLIATVRDENGAPISGVDVTWTTDAALVATVSNAGRITAVGNGSAEVTASVGAIVASATVSVQQVAFTLTLSPDTLRLAEAPDTSTIGRAVRDAGGSEVAGAVVTWATVDPAIATVNMAGRVTAAADGATTVVGQVAPGSAALTRSVRVEVGAQLPPTYLVGGYLGTSYTDQIGPATGAGGSFTHAVTAGALPTGLTLSSSTAQITGLPSASGVFFFQVTATNGVVTVSERYAITVSTKPASAFNLWVTYNGGALPPANARTALSAALARWEEVVTDDVGAAVTYPANGFSPGTCQLIDATILNSAFIEDIAIVVALDMIDGPGKTLARAGPCGIGRQTLPAAITGQMLLDEVDASSATATYLEDVIWHEIAHALGIGTLWQGSLINVATDSVKYIGTSGNAEWLALGGPFAGAPVQPTIEGHWHEAWFDGEIMTPTTEGSEVRMPISRMTIGTLIDLGFTASLAAADAYVLPVCAGACTVGPYRAEAPGEGAPFDDVVIERLLPLPPASIDRD
jgi:hypothetical protein